MVAAAPLEEVVLGEAAVLATEAPDEVEVEATEELLVVAATSTKEAGSI